MSDISNISMANLQQISSNLKTLDAKEIVGNLKGRKITGGKTLINLINRIISYFKTGTWYAPEKNAMAELHKEVHSLREFIEQSSLKFDKSAGGVLKKKSIQNIDNDRVLRIAVQSRLKEI